MLPDLKRYHFFSYEVDPQNTPSIHLLLVQPLCQVLELILTHESKSLPIPAIGNQELKVVKAAKSREAFRIQM